MGELKAYNRSETLKRRNAAIRSKYAQLKSKTKLGQQMLSEDYIVAEVAYIFYLSPVTVEDIIYYRKEKNN